MLNATTDDIAKPAFVIRFDGPARTAPPMLAEANAPARELWGIADASDLPIAIDATMPAIQDIRAQLAPASGNGGPAPADARAHLVFWTDRGAQRLACHCQPSADGTHVTVIVDDQPAAVAPEPAPAAPAPAGPPANALDLRTMAHELRTPIGAVIALADMIDQEPFGPLGDARYREYARDIRDSAHLALNIVAAALEHNQGEDAILLGGISEIDLEALLRKTRRALRLNAQSAGLAIEIETPPNMPLLLANPPGLNQILLNLIANAIKFTPPGGHITLAAAPTDSGGLAVFVTDTGIGMTEYETSVLVEPKSQGDAAPSATPPAAPVPKTNGAAGKPAPPSTPPRQRGIGFTLVRRLATAMGATLTVTSERGVGTRVAITFPAARVIPRPRTGHDADENA